MRRALIVVTVSLVTLACAPGGRSDLTVFAASSLSDALAAVKPAWDQAHPLSTLTISTGSSAALRSQIEQGAPADVFLSADTGEPAGPRRCRVDRGFAGPVATNSLVVVVPTDNPAGITTPADLANDGVQIVAARRRGADHALRRAGRGQPCRADRLSGGLRGRVRREHRQQGGERRGGHGQDRAGRRRRRTGLCDRCRRLQRTPIPIAIPAQANIVAEYAGVATTSSTNQAQAQAFLEWLAATSGGDILGRFGFGPPK